MGKPRTVKEIDKALNVLKLEKQHDVEYHAAAGSKKERVRFIKSIESAIRRSLEYKDYIAFLREFVDFDKCAFFPNIGRDNGKGGKVRIEVHHEPLTLYDIAEVVLDKYICEGRELNELYMADEVMELHYKNMVGLIPLSLTLHQLRHNNPDKLPIPLNMIYGNFMQFMEEYSDYIEEGSSIDLKLQAIVEISKNIKPEDYDAIIKDFLYVEVEDTEDLQHIEVEDTISATA